MESRPSRGAWQSAAQLTDHSNRISRPPSTCKATQARCRELHTTHAAVLIITAQQQQQPAMDYSRPDGPRSDEPAAVLEAALQQLAAQRQQQVSAQQAAAPAAARPAAPAFIAADRFAGARQGYFFGTGERGTG